MTRIKISIVIKVVALVFYFLLAFFLTKAQVISNFNADNESWTVFNGSSGASSPAIWSNSGGNPSGNISFNISSAQLNLWWTAPSKFNGNLSRAYNQNLTFDMQQSVAGTDNSQSDLVITSPGITLVYQLPSKPGTTWTSYAVQMNETITGWHLGSIFSGPPTQTQMKQALSNITNLQIRLKYSNTATSYTAQLDNIVLNIQALPTPPAISSFSPTSGLAGTSVTISGSNFNSTASQNVVYFNGVKGTVVNATATQLTVTSPTRISNGPITVVNLANGTQGVSNQNYNPLFDNNKDFGGQIIPASFGQKTDFGTSAEVGMSVGDLDGDGWTDVLTSGNGLKASVFLNLKQSGSVSSTSFAAPLVLSMPNSPANGAIQRVGQNSMADIDSDGKLDLIINVGYGSVNWNNGMVVFLNQSTPGSLSFSPGTVIEFNTINNNNGGMTIADIDGDGRPEFLGTLINSGCHLGIAQNLSTPGNVDFAAVQDFALGATMGNFISFGDLTGDGKPEIIVEAYLGGALSVYENLSTIGTIAMASPFTISTLVPSNVQVVDLDNDGKADLFYKDVSVASNLHLRKNNHISGALTVADFSADIIISNSFNGGSNSAYVGGADINGDNKLDIIGNDGANVFVYQNNNSGALSATSFLTGVGLKGGAAESSNAYVFFADIDGDNKPEILVKPQSVANFRVYHNESFPVPIINNASPSSGINGASVSINGNLMFTGNSSPSLRFNKIISPISGSPTNTLTATTNPLGSISGKITITNHGLTSFSPYFNTTFYTSRVITSSSFGPSIDFALGINMRDALEVGDFDDDGKSDVAVVDNFSTAKVFQNTNTVAQSISATSLALQSTTYAGGFNMLTLDIDGDGKVDLNSGADLFQNTSSGTISFAVGTSSSATGFNRAVSSDFNKDGKLDIATNNNGTNIQVIENRSTKGAFIVNGNFSPYSSTAINFTKGNGLGGIVAEDFDGDGYTDMISSNQVANNLTYYLNTKQLGVITTTSFSLIGNVSTGGSQPSGITANDFNGDGKIDIAVSFFNSAFVSVYLNNSTLGNISFAASVDLTSANKGYNLATQDLDGDGKAEIVVIHQPNPGPGSFTIFRNKSTSGALSFGAAVNIGLTRNPQGINFADINSDQKPDILIVANGGTGNALMVFENKITIPPSPPAITSFTPTSALAGATVTIVGTNFNTTASQNSVYFKNIKANVTTATATQLIVTVPTSAAFGQITVENISNGLQAASVLSFNPLFDNNKDFGGRIIPASLGRGYNAIVPMSASASNDFGGMDKGDLDGDGWIDLITTETSTSKIYAFRNLGTGSSVSPSSFSPAITLPSVSAVPSGSPALTELTVLDIDSDGKLDVVAIVNGSSSGNFAVFRNTTSSVGNISFATPLFFTYNSLPTAYYLGSGDLDGDGLIDLIGTTGTSPGNTWICQNQSTPGNIDFAYGFTLSVTSGYSDVVVGDLNGDGKPEIVSPSYNSPAQLSIYQNNSTPGTISMAAPFTIPAVVSYTVNLAMADLDADNKLDMVWSVYGSQYVYFTKNIYSGGAFNASSFGSTVQIPNKLAYPEGIAVGDINGDGKPDVIMSGYYDLAVLQNVGTTGNLSATSFLQTSLFQGCLSCYSNSTILSGLTPQIADLDGDNKPEAIFVSSSGSLPAGETGIYIFHNESFPAPTITGVSPTSASAGAVVSLNGNFMYTGNVAPTVLFNKVGSTINGLSNTLTSVTMPTGSISGKFNLTNHGLTTFSSTFNSTFGTQKIFNASSFGASINFPLTYGIKDALETADFDDDGKVDVVISDGSGARVFQNTATAGQSISSSSLTETATAFSAGANVIVGDIDGDNKVDFSGGGSGIFQNTSSGSTISFASSVFAPVSNPNGTASADFNKDGKVDVAITNGSANIQVFENLSSRGPFVYNGNLATYNTTPVTLSQPNGKNFGNGNNCLVSADFDGDGYDDLASTSSTDNTFTIFRNLGVYGFISSATFSTGVTTPTASQPYGVTANDFDGDGKVDLAVVHYNSTSINVYLNTSSIGSISFAAPKTLIGQIFGYNINAQDLDGDGKAEIVTTVNPNPGTPSFSIFQNTSTPGALNFGTAVTFNTIRYPQALTFADINSDSKPDILIVGYSSAALPASALMVFPNLIPSPVITITSQPISVYSVCDGATPTISTSASGTTNIVYQWQFSADGIALYTDLANTGGYSNVSTSSFTINSSGNFGTGFYRCKINGDFAATVYSNIVSFTVNAPPATPTTSDVNNCGPGSVVLTASGASNGNYLWYDTNGLIAGQNNSTYTSPVISSTSFYSVAITNGTCVSPKVNITASILSVPAAPTTSNVSNCGVTSFTLTASGASNGSYLWYDANGLINGQVNSSYVTPVISSTSFYSVAITDGTCVSPKVNITASILSVPAVPTTSNVSNCGATSFTLSASGASNGNYLWYDANGLIIGEVNSTYVTPTISSTTTYSVAITNGTCNSAQTTVTASINAIPIAPATLGSTECTGSTFILTASGATNGQYVWYTASSGGSPIPGQVNSTYATPALTTNTIYYVSINNGTCESARSAVTATVNTSGCSIPVITSTPLTTQVGGSVTLNLVQLITTANNNLNVSSIVVIQQPASGAVASVSNGVLTVDYNGITFSGSEQITVQACDTDGNCATQVFTLNVAGDIVIYNGISPNGKNPAFIIEYIDLLPETKLNTVNIFDRWENLVWHGNNYDNSSVVFTGTSDGGSDLPSGVYYYKINFSSGRKTETGFLSLRRQ